MALTQITGSGISGVTVGNFITMADQWKLSADTNSGSNADVTANWERFTVTGWGGIGTGLTESSGIFSFPSTGVYLIQYNALFSITSDTSASLKLEITTNNSSFTSVNRSLDGGGASASTSNSFLFDVTNTTNDKFKFVTIGFASGTALRGHATESRTGFTVIRLGST